MRALDSDKCIVACIPYTLQLKRHSITGCDFVFCFFLTFNHIIYYRYGLDITQEANLAARVFLSGCVKQITQRQQNNKIKCEGSGAGFESEPHQ